MDPEKVGLRKEQAKFEMLRKQTVEDKGRGKATKGFVVLSKKL